MQSIHQSQPASPLYVFDRGWRIIRYALILLWSQSNEVAEWWIDKVRLMGSFASGRNWFIKCCIYFWICCVVLIAVVQFLAMVVAAAFFLGVYTLFLAAWLGGCLALI